MRSILRSEFYKLTHNYSFAILMAVIVLVTLAVSALSIAKPVHDVLVYQVAENDDYTSAIQSAIAKEIYARYTGKDYIISIDVVDYVKENEQVDDKLVWLLQQKHTEGLYIEDTLYDSSDAHALDQWRFPRIMGDYSGIMLLSTIFAAFFFGRDYVLRGYTSLVSTGKQRAVIVLGKYIVYIAISTLLSLVTICIMLTVYTDSVVSLGFGYMMKSIAIRLIVDVGLLCLPAFFSFLFRDMVKSAGFGFLFLVAFFSNRSIIGFDLLRAYTNEQLWEYAADSQHLIMAVVTTMIIALSSITISVLAFEHTDLK